MFNILINAKNDEARPSQNAKLIKINLRLIGQSQKKRCQ